MPFRYAFIGAGRSHRSKCAMLNIISSLGRYDDKKKRPVYIGSIMKHYPKVSDLRASYYDPNIKTAEEYSIAREMGCRTVLINTQGDWPTLLKPSDIDHVFNVKDINPIIWKLLGENSFLPRDTNLLLPYDASLELSERSLDYTKTFIKTMQLADKL